MQLETILEYDESLIREAVFAYWRRTVGTWFVPVLLILTACFAVQLVQRDFSWQTGVFGTILGMGFLFSASVYIVHYRNAIAKFRDMAGANATFRVEDNSFAIESSIGASTLRWTTVKELWQFQNVWLLLFSKAHFCTLPLANLSPEMQRVIVERVQAAGGKIG